MRRVAIENDALTYVSTGPELVPEDLSTYVDPNDDDPGDLPLESEVEALIGEGWTARTIAGYLGISETRVHEICPEHDDDFRQTPAEVYGLEPEAE